MPCIDRTPMLTNAELDAIDADLAVAIAAHPADFQLDDDDIDYLTNPVRQWVARLALFSQRWIVGWMA